MNHNSPREIASLLDELGAGLKKRWGQNFLISADVRTRILDLLAPEPGTRVWEIGPGLGSMTSELLERGVDLTAFEIDWAFVRHLQATLGSGSSGSSDGSDDGSDGSAGSTGEHAAQFQVVQGDAIKTIPEQRAVQGDPDYLLGNLPYSVASAIIAQILEIGMRSRRIVVMVQRELADRMVAVPGTKDYSAFSVLCATHARMNKAFDVAPGCFYPAPDVISTVVEIQPGAAYEMLDTALLSRLVRELFASRRKTIRNNLKGSGVAAEYGPDMLQAAMTAAEIDPAARAESLSPEQFVRAANVLAATRAG